MTSQSFDDFAYITVNYKKYGCSKTVKPETYLVSLYLPFYPYAREV